MVHVNFRCVQLFMTKRLACCQANQLKVSLDTSENQKIWQCSVGPVERNVRLEDSRKVYDSKMVLLLLQTNSCKHWARVGIKDWAMYMPPWGRESKVGRSGVGFPWKTLGRFGRAGLGKEKRDWKGQQNSGLERVSFEDFDQVIWP